MFSRGNRMEGNQGLKYVYGSHILSKGVSGIVILRGRLNYGLFDGCVLFEASRLMSLQAPPAKYEILLTLPPVSVILLRITRVTMATKGYSFSAGLVITPFNEAAPLEF